MIVFIVAGVRVGIAIETVFIGIDADGHRIAFDDVIFDPNKKLIGVFFGSGVPFHGVQMHLCGGIGIVFTKKKLALILSSTGSSLYTGIILRYVLAVV